VGVSIAAAVKRAGFFAQAYKMLAILHVFVGGYISLTQEVVKPASSWFITSPAKVLKVMAYGFFLMFTLSESVARLISLSFWVTVTLVVCGLAITAYEKSSANFVYPYAP
jgi:hypothetical protein